MDVIAIDKDSLEIQEGDQPSRIAFEAGDYSRAYQLANASELKGCCLVMLGCFEEGLALIKQSTDSCSLFCSAVAYWGLKNKYHAILQLQKIETTSRYATAADNLIKLIQQPRIKLLFQGRDDPSSPDYDFAGNLRSLSYVDIKTVGYSERSDIVIKPHTTFKEIISQLNGWVPNIFISHMIEDHPPPIGVETAPFMTFCHTQDYDRHFHHCYHYLRLFDAIISLGSADHDDLVRLASKPVFVFPMLLGLDPRSEGKIENLEKDIDIYISGTLFNNNDEKSRYIYQLSQLENKYRIVLHPGFTSAEDYCKSLRRAKCTFTYVNRWGLINGRAIEAISEGCCALYQEGGELGIFLKPEDGAIPYKLNNLQTVIKDVIENWEQRYALYAQRGAKKVRRIFNFQQCVSRYLTVVLANAALLGFHKQKSLFDPAFTAIRYINRSPHRIPYSYDNNLGKLYELQKLTRKNLENRDDYAAVDALAESYLYSYLSLKKNIFQVVNKITPLKLWKKLFLILLRCAQCVKLKAIFLRRASLALLRITLKLLIGAPMKHLWVTRSIDCYKLLIKKYPQRIAAYFNLGRLYYAKREYKKALEIFNKIIADESLIYYPEDILFWREFYDDFFDYDLMMRECVQYRRFNDPAILVRIKLIIIESSLCYILSILDKEKFQQALPLLKNFENLTTGLPKLAWYQFKFKIEEGKITDAVNGIKEFFSRKPWHLLTIGDDVFSLARQNKIELKDLYAQYELLQSRVTSGKENIGEQYVA